jgi:N-acetylglucosaminyl-diphospho-decaprenol L-rhamnosyltransferase
MDTNLQYRAEDSLLTEDSLLVVIVNYRTPKLTIDCLQSLENEVRSLPGTRVVVVDNVSGDNSVEAIAAAGWDWASLLPSEHNGGYAYGNNLAIRPMLQIENHPPIFCCSIPIPKFVRVRSRR